MKKKIIKNKIKLFCSFKELFSYLVSTSWGCVAELVEGTTWSKRSMVRVSTSAILCKNANSCSGRTARLHCWVSARSNSGKFTQVTGSPGSVLLSLHCSWLVDRIRWVSGFPSPLEASLPDLLGGLAAHGRIPAFPNFCAYGYRRVTNCPRPR